MSHIPQHQLIDFHYGELNAAESREVREHLANCEACRADLAALETIGKTLYTLEDSSPPANGFEQLMNRIPTSEMISAPQIGRLQVAPYFLLLIAIIFSASIIGIFHQNIAALSYFEWFHQFAVVDKIGSLGFSAILLSSIGVLLTAAIAPVLILEMRQRRNIQRL